MINPNTVSKITVKTEEEMITQLKLLLDNGYYVAVHKNDNLLGCVDYQLMYAKKGAD